MPAKVTGKLVRENSYAMKTWYKKEEVVWRDHHVMQIHKVLTITQGSNTFNCNLE